MYDVDFCRNYHAATGLHVALLDGNKAIWSSIGSMLDIPLQDGWPLWKTEQNPVFCSIPPHTLYGIVQVKGTHQRVVLGPVFNITVTEPLLQQLTEALRLSFDRKEDLRQALCMTPLMNSLQLARHLSLVNYILNGENIPYSQVYSQARILTPDNEDLRRRMDRLESGELHNAYYFEVELYQKVREGKPELLGRFFQEHAHIRMSEGKMADNPLRHAKNVFLSQLFRTGFIGAIPGGLDVEKTYQLMDYYSQEAERLTSVEAVANLQYAMVMDFCQRTGEARRPEHISSDVWHCMNYIRSNVYMQLTVADVAADVHRSVSYVTKKFRRELNTHVTAFINRCKLEEAQTLLIYSEKTLAEISQDLCFSTQSYFQNLFKREYGLTPAQFRRQRRTI